MKIFEVEFMSSGSPIWKKDDSSRLHIGADKFFATEKDLEQLKEYGYGFRKVEYAGELFDQSSIEDVSSKNNSKNCVKAAKFNPRFKKDDIVFVLNMVLSPEITLTPAKIINMNKFYRIEDCDTGQSEFKIYYEVRTYQADNTTIIEQDNLFLIEEIECLFNSSKDF